MEQPLVFMAIGIVTGLLAPVLLLISRRQEKPFRKDLWGAAALFVWAISLLGYFGFVIKLTMSAGEIWGPVTAAVFSLLASLSTLAFGMMLVSGLFKEDLI